jgi:hypothetical protein
MAGPIAKLYATLGLDAREFTTGVDKAQTKTQSFISGFKSQAKAGVGLGVGIGAGTMAFNALSTGVGFAVDVLGDAVTAAMEEEAAIATLTRAIEENDRAWDGNIDAVEDVIDARQALAFADDEQRDSLQRLVSVTGDINKALELQRTAMDLARLRGMDLATAGDLIGKVYAGNLGTLSRYGIVLAKGTTATEALAEIQRRAAGQAEAYADTTQGRFLQAQLAMNNAMEELGTLILPVVSELAVFAAGALRELGRVIGEVTGHIERANELVTEFGANVNDTVGRDLVNDAANFGRIFATGGLSLFTDKVNEMGLGIDGLGHGVGEFVNGPMEEYEEKARELAFVTEGTAGVVERSWGAVADDTVTLGERITAAFGAAVDHLETAGMAQAIEMQFAAARKAILSGFGSLKAALSRESRPQLISRADRVQNMEERQKRINRELNRAVEADDPWNIAYWTKAAAKQQVQLENMRGKGRTTTKDVARDFAGMGLDIQGTMFDLPKYAKTAAEGVRAAFTGVNMTTVGLSMMQGVAAGITQGTPLISGAAAAAAAAGRAASTGVNSGNVGTNININGNVYGGKAGTRQLAADIDRATRPTNRYRRHNNLAEG